MTIKPIANTTQKRANAPTDATKDIQEDSAGANGSNANDVQQLTAINATRSPIVHTNKGQRTTKPNEAVYDELARTQRNNLRSAQSARVVRQQTRERTEQSRAAAALRGKSGSPTESAAKNATENTLAAAADEAETFAGYNSGDEHEPPKKGVVSAAEWKKRDEQFVKMLSERRGFVVQQVEEDGACLFRAISLQLYGDEDMHDVIRQNVMDYIYKNREYFCHFVTEDINSYIKRKRRKDSHGNHIEIQVMSEIYSRPVEVYCYDSNPINIFNSEQMTNRYTPLRLSYQRGSHYNAILDPYNATVGIGLGLAGYEPELQTKEAQRLSEQLEIERTMFEDKLKTTDWEATNEAIEEQIARESYLQWCRDNYKRSHDNAKITSTITSGQAESAASSKYVQRSATSTTLEMDKSMSIEVANDAKSSEDKVEDKDCDKDEELTDNKNVIHSSKKRRRDQISKSPAHFESVTPSKELSDKNLLSRKSPKYANDAATALATNVLDDANEQPSTSKRSTNAVESVKQDNSNNKSVSNLYAELLEAAVTKDSCHLSEMQRAIQLSREDYINAQKRIYMSNIKNDNNSYKEWQFEK